MNNLAVELKIQTLKIQRLTIKEALDKIKKTSKDVLELDTAKSFVYIYEGQLYPENKVYFESEGFEIREDTQSFIPRYLFLVSQDIMLTKEQLEEAEQACKTAQEMFPNFTV